MPRSLPTAGNARPPVLPESTQPSLAWTDVGGPEKTHGAFSRGTGCGWGVLQAGVQAGARPGGWCQEGQVQERQAVPSGEPHDNLRGAAEGAGAGLQLLRAPLCPLLGTEGPSVHERERQTGCGQALGPGHLG